MDSKRSSSPDSGKENRTPQSPALPSSPPAFGGTTYAADGAPISEHNIDVSSSELPSQPSSPSPMAAQGSYTPPNTEPILQVYEDQSAHASVLSPPVLTSKRSLQRMPAIEEVATSDERSRDGQELQVAATIKEKRKTDDRDEGGEDAGGRNKKRKE